MAHLVWILVFDDQHNQVGLMCLQVYVLLSNRLHSGLRPRVEHEELINTLRKILRGCVINLEVKLGVQDAKIKKPGPRHEQS